MNKVSKTQLAERYKSVKRPKYTITSFEKDIKFWTRSLNQYNLETNQFTTAQLQPVGREKRRDYSLFNADEEQEEVKRKVLEENGEDIKARKG